MAQSSSYAITGRCRGDHPEEGEASPIMFNKYLWVCTYAATIWLSETPHMPSLCWHSPFNRVATIGIFRNNFVSGYQVLVVNTHYDLHQSCREKSSWVLIDQILDIASRFGCTETIVMGDFNAER
jgi:endonuclease/exonuclease/phosphatase family metal-dependent hydrolase